MDRVGTGCTLWEVWKNGGVFHSPSTGVSTEKIPAVSEKKGLFPAFPSPTTTTTEININILSCSLWKRDTEMKGSIP